MRRRTQAIAVLVTVVVGGLWLHARARRLEVEHKAGAVATRIAGRDVRVICPGPIRRRILYEINDGSVMFDAHGRPANKTKLSAHTCDGLRRVLDRTTSLDLTCLATDACSPDDEQAAAGLAVLTHESVHLRGVMDESETECEARKRVATTATELGLTRASAEAVAAWQATTWAKMLPERYRLCPG